MNLSDVSQTAIYTLLCRVVQTEKGNPVINDPMASICLEKLMSIASKEEKERLLKWRKMVAGIGASDAKRIAQRANEIDAIVNTYIANHPSGTVIGLACGFDTRFWRIENDNCNYLELDFPEVVALKKEILKEHLNYELIGSSVLDATWIDRVTEDKNTNFLLIAEGLFMYLPKPKAIELLQVIARRFNRSQFVLDMVPERYTRGFGQKVVTWQFKLFMGVDVIWEYGIEDPRDIEDYGDGYKVIDASESFPWVITASINENI